MASHHLLGEVRNEGRDEDPDRGQPAMGIGWALRFELARRLRTRAGAWTGWETTDPFGNLYSGDPAPRFEQGGSGSHDARARCALPRRDPTCGSGAHLSISPAPLIRAPQQKRCEKGWIGQARRREVRMRLTRHAPAEDAGEKRCNREHPLFVRLGTPSRPSAMARPDGHRDPRRARRREDPKADKTRNGWQLPPELSGASHSCTARGT